MVGTLAVLGLTAVAVKLLASGNGFRAFALSELVTPGAVAGWAAALPEDEDEFILAAWGLVGGMAYDPVPSHLDLVDGSVRGEHLALPLEVLGQGVGNCVGRSLLLVSLLRGRLPPERVMVGVGLLSKPEQQGGHAWALAQRADGRWYLLEATAPAGAWVEAGGELASYIPYIYLNDALLFSSSDQLAFILGGPRV